MARANTNNALHVKWNVHAKTVYSNNWLCFLTVLQLMVYSNNFQTLHSSPLTDIRRRKIEFPCHASSVTQFSCSLCRNRKKFWVMCQLRVGVRIDELQAYSSEFR
jgi:hypothetical protein